MRLISTWLTMIVDTINLFHVVLVIHVQKNTFVNMDGGAIYVFNRNVIKYMSKESKKRM